MSERSEDETENVYFGENGDENGADARRRRNILSVPVSIDVIVGAARMTVEELLNANTDTIIKLDVHIDDPVVLKIGQRVVARGELLEVDDDPSMLAVQITEVIDEPTP
ncbi:MAG: FliM/FliN family flagellar motor switch protein [Parvularculaceae bacterium]|nr:FliM/FliN family flagellar motor switch protein [Parvularculaceae bacterium]